MNSRRQFIRGLSYTGVALLVAGHLQETAQAIFFLGGETHGASVIGTAVG